MFLRNWTTKSTENYSDNIKKLRNELETADAVVIGAGAGLSTSAGLSYSGERFEKYFSDFAKKYGIRDMYSGGFFPYASFEEYWAYWSRYIWVNRYMDAPKDTYARLLEIVKDKDYFVLTTNVDHCFQKAGFDKKRLFYTQGDYGLFQCSVPCHNETYDNEELIRRMVAEQKDMRIPTDLIPHCPICGKPMTMNLRSDDKFVQDKGWEAACERYENFIKEHKDKCVLFLELGVGFNTPVIIKYPFMRMTQNYKNAHYACINKGEVLIPPVIENKAIGINGDIYGVLQAI